MPDTPTNPVAVENIGAAAFIARWRGVTASELPTAQSFVIDLCALLGVDKPHPTPDQSYMFERPVTFRHGDGSGSVGRIDCYRQGAFCLESKKLKGAGYTKGFDDGLLRAPCPLPKVARRLCWCTRQCRFRHVLVGTSSGVGWCGFGAAHGVDHHQQLASFRFQINTT
jgi:hypothetical protein